MRQTSSLRQPTNRRNENVQPKSEWKHEEGATILSIYLPGFVEERIKMIIDEPTRTLKVQGQRPVEMNRWIRFSERFSIPDNCDISKINTQFKLGVLRIRMPKLIVATQTSHKEEATDTKETLTPQESIEGDLIPGKGPETNNARKRSHNQNIQAQIPRKPNSEVTPTPNTKKRRNENSADEVTEGKKEKSSEANEMQKINVEDKPAAIVKKKESSERSKESKEPASFQKKTEEKENEKEKSEISGANDFRQKPEDDSSPEKVKQMEIVSAASKENLKGLAMELNEESQLLVNMGTAVLVIVGLVAYIFYTHLNKNY